MGTGGGSESPVGKGEGLVAQDVACGGNQRTLGGGEGPCSTGRGLWKTSRERS